MRCLFGSPFPFFFFFFRSQRIFFFKISLHIFFQTCRYYHLFIMYILVLQHRWKSQEKTGRVFLNNNEQSEIPRRFILPCLLFFFYFQMPLWESGRKGLFSGGWRAKTGSIHILYTQSLFFLSYRLYYHHHLLGEKVIYNGTLYLLLSF
ncbi:LOW QUALITY PROTEIN: uncharacterized protein QC763_702300 [Podospora pseudopauciseta]|uniref:Uncharacterized protein n=1 Tax=Podospora pseudopauciseta TaxID=2093780 RepID=A0ABR0H064_9PEZI|nr:LOW QUALITY PROTEIN: hypothetical protein QC763_702300 [Podospora pseudopauciseta]